MLAWSLTPIPTKLALLLVARSSTRVRRSRARRRRRYRCGRSILLDLPPPRRSRPLQRSPRASPPPTPGNSVAAFAVPVSAPRPRHPARLPLGSLCAHRGPEAMGRVPPALTSLRSANGIPRQRGPWPCRVGRRPRAYRRLRPPDRLLRKPLQTSVLGHTSLRRRISGLLALDSLVRVSFEYLGLLVAPSAPSSLCSALRI